MRSDQFNPRRSADDAEKPFWISYADLMTALMILFLVIMVTALTSISVKTQAVIEEKKEVTQIVNNQEKRAVEIASICDELAKKTAAALPRVQVDCKLNRINFGELGRFKTDQYRLNAEAEQLLQNLVPIILDTANSPSGQKWLKQVLIEGFTDTDGSYLYNLNLSLKRSEWVMCTLLRNDKPSPVNLSAEQRKQLKKLFLAGGVSFNNGRDSKDESRRVELRLQFYGLESEAHRNAAHEMKFEESSIERCMI